MTNEANKAIEAGEANETIETRRAGSATGGGRVWLITGASSGFGRALAEAVLAAGDAVVAAARRTEPLAELVARYPDRARAIALDVTDQQRAAAAVADVVLWYGRIDVLVNNAGRGMIGAVEETTDRELRDLMDLHLFGPAALTRAVLPHLRAQGSGAIVQLTSMGGRVSFAGVGAYSATKFALTGLTEALAEEVAPFGIKVMLVEPGAFRTGFAGGALAQTTPLEAYADSVGAFRKALPESDGQQPGDPAKAAAAIIAALDAEQTPLHLPLGDDAYAVIRDRMQAAERDMATWEKVGRGVNFDD
jgi:NAD(P)-dependent dehydrogenase (short-subunit alcohol dehydrogenase family)